MSVFKYRKRAEVLDAIKFDGKNFKDCEQFIGKENYDNMLNYPNLKTSRGVYQRVEVNDYIVKSLQGVFYLYDTQFFEDNYYLVAQ